MENHHFSWENQLFRLGHVQVRKLLVITRSGNPNHPKIIPTSSPKSAQNPPNISYQFQVISQTLGWTPMALLITSRDSKQRNRLDSHGEMTIGVDENLHDDHVISYVFMGYMDHIWGYFLRKHDYQWLSGSYYGDHVFPGPGWPKWFKCPPSVELQARQADSFIGQLAKGEGGLRVAHVHHDPRNG